MINKLRLLIRMMNNQMFKNNQKKNLLRKLKKLLKIKSNNIIKVKKNKLNQKMNNKFNHNK